MFLKNYCTEFMILPVMVFITSLFTLQSLIIFNFPLVFKISPFLLEFMYKFHKKNKTCRHEFLQTRVNAVKKISWDQYECKRSLFPGPGFLSSATWPLIPKKHSNGLINQSFSLPRPECCNLIGLWSVKISWSWHFEVPRRYFLTLDYATIERT